jgi:predicted choloylglycine hydrolase
LRRILKPTKVSFTAFRNTDFSRLFFETIDKIKLEGAKIAQKNIPASLLEEMIGITDGANYAGYNVTFDEIQLWNTMYDQWCIYAHPHYWNIDDTTTKGQYPKDGPGTTVLTGSGCSSFSAWDDSVGGDGDMIFCKNEDNLDLPYQLENRYLYIVNPDNGNSHLYLCFPGMIGMDGGFNEKGISMMTQYNASIDETMDGCGIGIFTRLLLTNANNLDEAIQTFYEYPRCTGIAYHCADAHAKKAAVVETSSKITTVRYPMENTTRLWQANDSICYPGYQGYSGYNMVYDQQLVYELEDVSSIEKYLQSQKDPYNFTVPAPCRFERYDYLLNDNYGKIDVEIAKEIMSDRYDPYTKKTRPKISTSYTNNILATISAYYPKELFTHSPNGEFRAGVANLWSLISYPASGDFWLAIDEFPANQGSYKQFNFFDLLNKR